MTVIDYRRSKKRDAIGSFQGAAVIGFFESVTRFKTMSANRLFANRTFRKD